ncbi:unnamed protein product [Phyllotreta striolata]|uniref:Transcription cofactor vestigial-like protein 4 n=1 Tax=Phyllotreta striolata TaxID=444603 RepID=A0A9N9TXM2_PHYSR|nr:unnamed protein product [Phyllotreta striolata]
MNGEVVQKLIRVALMMRDNGKTAGEIGNEKMNGLWQPWLDEDDPTKPYTKHTPKWKRDRRPRPPDYPRKTSDPKYPEQRLSGESSPSPPASASPDVPTSVDAPLDMSVRQRGLPPSYAQTISNPGYRSNYRPSVIHNGAPKDELPSGISMCDPIIDEHFRRSLGNDYHIVFQNNNSSKEASVTPPKSPPPAPPTVPAPAPAPVKTTSSVIELMDGTGLSVDDHFAKALGDTWTKLNRKDADRQNASENGLVST